MARRAFLLIKKETQKPARRRQRCLSRVIGAAGGRLRTGGHQDLRQVGKIIQV